MEEPLARPSSQSLHTLTMRIGGCRQREDHPYEPVILGLKSLSGAGGKKRRLLAMLRPGKTKNPA